MNAEDKVFIKQSDIFEMVEETNGFKPNQKVIGWYYSGDDEIVFYTNRKDHATEHYGLIEFVATVCSNFKSVNDMRCNQFEAGSTGTVNGLEDGFFFYRDEGSTDCHSIPEDLPTIERANVMIEWRTDSSCDEDTNACRLG